MMHCQVLVAWLLGGIAAPAAAQTAPEPAPAPQTPAGGVQAAATPGQTNGQRVYEAAYFAAFSPSTAAQIVQHVPGFTLESGDQEVRGFSGAAGNVVINGQRPSSKADSIDTILARIPATRVLRVEVGPGDLYGADYASKAQVLNLVLTASGGVAGTIQGGVLGDFTGRVQPFGSVSALVKRGRSTFNASVALEQQRTSEEGTDQVRTLPAGTVLENRIKTNRIVDPNGAVSASWAFDDGTNRTVHLNGRAAYDRLALTQSNHVVPVGGTVRDDRLTQRYASDAYELGGDVTRPFAGGGIKLIGLATRRHRLYRDVSLNRTEGGATVLGGSTQMLDDQRDETLARLVWNRSNLAGWSVELGAEGVLNRLDSQVDLFRLASGGVATRIDLPVDHAVVEEKRGEAFVQAGRPVTKTLRVDLGLTYERSRLTVSGDATADRTLQFVKPKVTLDWRPGGKWHAQLAVSRTVAQLQFEDFISSAELTNDRVNGGNADLLPQRSWEALLTVEHPLLGDGLVKVDLGYTRIALVQDRVPTPDGFDAPGNLGDGQVLIARGRLEAPLTRLGIKGGRLTLYVSYADTRVVDPYTLQPRYFSGNVPLVGEVEFRQDGRHFAWGLSASARDALTFFRQDELDRNTNSGVYMSGFVDWRPRPTTTVSLKLDNLLQTGGLRRRTFFAPDRRTPAPFLVENRERNQHIIPVLSVRHSFG